MPGLFLQADQFDIWSLDFSKTSGILGICKIRFILKIYFKKYYPTGKNTVLFDVRSYLYLHFYSGNYKLKVSLHISLLIYYLPAEA